MTRPVKGFLTFDGKYFDEKAQADLYEATHQLYTFAAAFIDKTPDFAMMQDDRIKWLLNFTKLAENEIKDYYNAVEAQAALGQEESEPRGSDATSSEESEDGTGVVGQTTKSDQGNGEQVRDATSNTMDENPVPETKSKRSGKSNEQKTK
jgi:hypothetical protein